MACDAAHSVDKSDSMIHNPINNRLFKLEFTYYESSREKFVKISVQRTLLCCLLNFYSLDYWRRRAMKGASTVAEGWAVRVASVMCSPMPPKISNWKAGLLS